MKSLNTLNDGIVSHVSAHRTGDFFHNLYTKKALPILLSKDVLQNMQKDFYQFDGSLATVAMQIKKALAEHFSKRGKTLTLMVL